MEEPGISGRFGHIGCTSPLVDGLKIFFNDPVLPDNGHAGRNWRDDFQLTLHIQDDVRVTREVGNIFFTNIHRAYRDTWGRGADSFIAMIYERLILMRDLMHE